MINISIPIREDILRATARYFTELADMEALADSDAGDPVSVDVPFDPKSKPIFTDDGFVMKIMSTTLPATAPDGFVEEIRTVETAPESPEPPAVDDVPEAPPPEIDVDSAGVAWDPELHSANKSTNKDGTWRARRGVSAADAAPPPPPPPPPQPQPPAPATVDFVALMQKARELHGGAALEKLNAIARGLGVPAAAMLAGQPALIPAAMETLVNGD